MYQTYFSPLQKCLDDKEMGDCRLTGEKAADAFLHWMSHLTKNTNLFLYKSKITMANQRSHIINESARRRQSGPQLFFLPPAKLGHRQWRLNGCHTHCSINRVAEEEVEKRRKFKFISHAHHARKSLQIGCCWSAPIQSVSSSGQMLRGNDVPSPSCYGGIRSQTWLCLALHPYRPQVYYLCSIARGHTTRRRARCSKYPLSHLWLSRAN